MADNVVINPMSGGAVIAADDIGGGVVVQRVKVGYGPDGSFTDVGVASPLPASIVSGSAADADQVRVPTPGTPVQLPDHPQIYGLTIRALLGNAGLIYVGGLLSVSVGFELAPGDAVSLDVDNSDAVYIDATSANDGVCLLWVSA